MTPAELALVHAAAFSRTRPWTEYEFADLLSNRFTHLIGTLSSFAVVQVIADEAELLTIATHPDYQRQGLARQVLIEFHALAAGLDARRAFLDVAADNHAAIALYESCNYSRCGLRKGYYRFESGEKLDAILMERALT